MFNLIVLKILTMNVPYYYNPKMHSLGNIGFGGKIHAEAALFATKTIDKIRYKGKNIRKEIYEPYVSKNKTLLDMCCGIGISTPPGQIGIDTSHEMLEVAKKNNKNNKANKSFILGNAETFRPSKEIDIDYFNKNELSTTLGEISQHLNEQGKVSIVEKCVIMSLIDGDIAEEEIATISEIAISLGIPDGYVPGIIQNTIQKISNKD